MNEKHARHKHVVLWVEPKRERKKNIRINRLILCMPKTGNTNTNKETVLRLINHKREHRTNKSISNVWSHRLFSFFSFTCQMHIIPAYFHFLISCQFCLTVRLFDCMSSKRFEIKLISNWQIHFNLSDSMIEIFGTKMTFCRIFERIKWKN